VAIVAARQCEPLVSDLLIVGAAPLVRCAVEDCVAWPSLTRRPVDLTERLNHCIVWGGKRCSIQLFGHPLKLVILDVAGVILDLMANFAPHLEAAAEQLHLPREPIRDYLAAVHHGACQSYTSLPEATQAWWPMLSQRDRTQFVECFRTIERDHPYPTVEGSLETIQWLRRQQIPVALCTMNDRQTLDYRLHSAGVDLEWFVTASTWESGHPKPDSKALDPIFAVLPVPREQAVYVGDWYPDVDAARGGGVRFIAVLSGGIPRHAFLLEGMPQDHIMACLQYLPSLIQTP